MTNRNKLVREPTKGRPSAARRIKVGNRDGWACVYCGEQVVHEHNHPREFTVDHLVPRYRGGNHDEHNLVTACRTCNNTRGMLDADPDVFAELVANDRIDLMAPFVRLQDRPVMNIRFGDVAVLVGRVVS